MFNLAFSFSYIINPTIYLIKIPFNHYINMSDQPICPNCSNPGFYNLPKTKDKFFCAEHRSKGMVKVLTMYCRHSDCLLKPNFNYKDKKKPTYCGKHKLQNMCNTSTRWCLEPGCEKSASYGLTKTDYKYCTDHKKEGMISRYACKHEGCTKHPSYGPPKTNRKIYCAKHAPKGMTCAYTACKFGGCDEYAIFGYSKPATCCIHHKKEDMINVYNNCMEHNCKDNANYNYPNVRPAVYCAKHKKDGMINTHKKACIMKNCNTSASFKDENGILKYCSKHKTDKCVIRNKKCVHPGCTTIPSYGYKDGKSQYCASHKTDEMIRLKHRTCQHDKCTKIPHFNKPGELLAIYCSEHAPKGYVDIKNKKCEYSGCKKRPCYGYIKDRKQIRCASHKEDGMINIKRKKCKHTECNNTPSYGYTGTKTRIYCSIHKLKGMTDVSRVLCSYNNCLIQPIFNYKGQKSGKYCNKHKEDGMIDVTNTYCIICEKIQARYGLPGGKRTHCYTHKLDGMIANPRKKCINLGCNEIAIYGVGGAKHCESHMEQGEINYVERRCKSCQLLAILDSNNNCQFCDPNEQNRAALAKQRRVKQYLDSHNITYSSYDRPINASICGKERPDFMFESTAGSHYVILEVDENQHFGRPEDCECTRMVNISQSLGMPTIFIRYNPDSFKFKDKKKDPTFSTRMKILADTIKYATALSPEKLQDVGYCSMRKLFFNGKEEDTGYHTVLEFDDNYNILKT